MIEELLASLAPLLSYFDYNHYLQALVVVVLSFFAAWVFDKVIITGLRQFALKTPLDFDNDLIDLLQSPIYYSLLLLGFTIVLKILSVPEYGFSFIVTIALFVWTAFFLRSSRVVITQLSQQEKRFKIIHQQTLPIFLNMINIFIVIMMVYLIFTAWGVNMNAWLASAGVVGIAVGFAAKDTLANLFAGIFIMADAPYKIGDFIVLDSAERGEVTHIGIRSTRILTGTILRSPFPIRS